MPPSSPASSPCCCGSIPAARPDEILATDPVFLKELGLIEALSTNRGNGIAAMARAIRERAAAERSIR